MCRTMRRAIDKKGHNMPSAMSHSKNGIAAAAPRERPPFSFPRRPSEGMNAGWDSEDFAFLCREESMDAEHVSGNPLAFVGVLPPPLRPGRAVAARGNAAGFTSRAIDSTAFADVWKIFPRGGLGKLEMEFHFLLFSPCPASCCLCLVLYSSPFVGIFPPFNPPCEVNNPGNRFRFPPSSSS